MPPLPSPALLHGIFDDEDDDDPSQYVVKCCISNVQREKGLGNGYQGSHASGEQVIEVSLSSLEFAFTQSNDDWCRL